MIICKEPGGRRAIYRPILIGRCRSWARFTLIRVIRCSEVQPSYAGLVGLVVC